MKPKDDREQHIAVFGESGSGKTVLVSSFYGATREHGSLNVVAEDPGQHRRLYGNYLGMRDDDRKPTQTRFASTPYAFSVKLKAPSQAGRTNQPFDSVRLVWHDYPGEWFEADVSGPEEAQRRIDTFRSLLSSDVAFLLVDGEQLLKHEREEERYLKSLLSSYSTGLERLKDQLLDDGKPLLRFPRIWILALSKADLLPDLDVVGFQDLVIRKAADDLDELQRVLEGLVDSGDALSVGEDFVRLSSARFEPTHIEVSERIGIDLILPIAAYLPFERHLKWIQRTQISTKLAEQFRASVAPVAIMLTKKSKFLKASPVAVVGRVLAMLAINAAADLTSEQLSTLNEDSLTRKDDMTALLAQFALDLDRGEEERVVLRSKR